MNNVSLVGRLTKDFELKYGQSGNAMGSFTLAIDRAFKNADGNREADFINCVIFRKGAELMANMAHKGSQVAVTGRIQTRNYDNKAGQRVYVTEVVVNEFKMLDSKKDNGARPQQQTATNLYRPDQVSGREIGDISDDDLPFQGVDVIATQRQERAAALKLALEASDKGDYKTAHNLLSKQHSWSGGGDGWEFWDDCGDKPDISLCETTPTQKYIPEIMPKNRMKTYYDKVTKLWFYGWQDASKAFGLSTRKLNGLDRLVSYDTRKVYECDGKTGDLGGLADKFKTTIWSIQHRAGLKYLGAKLIETTRRDWDDE